MITATPESDVRRAGHDKTALKTIDRYPIHHAVLLLSLFPLVLYLLWGGHLPDEAYVLLWRAQGLAGAGWAGSQSLLHPLPAEPLLLGILTASEWLALPSPALAGVVAAAGWSAAIAVLMGLSRRLEPVQPFMIAALLLACSPLLISTGGSGSGWAVAVCLLLLAPSPEKQWRQELPAVALLLVVLDPTTLLVAALFLLWQWREQRRLPWAALILLLLVTLTWYGGQTWTSRQPEMWVATVLGLLHESEFYWFFLPALAMGLLTLLAPALRPVSHSVYQRILLLFLAGGAGLLLGSRFAMTLLAVLGLVLVGLGGAGLLMWLERGERLAVSPRQAALGITLLVALPLLAAEVASLWQRYHFRPVAWQEMEREAALWLRAESEAHSTLWSSHRAAYDARRPLGASDDAVLNGGRLQEALASVRTEAPAYVLADDGLNWDRVTRSSWFRIRYCPVHQVSSPAEPRSPLTVWQFQGPAEQRITFGLRTLQGFELVDARIEPTHIEPGATVTLNLDWKAICSLSGPFEMRVQMTTLLDGALLAENRIVAPQTISFDDWQPGQLLQESYPFTVTGNLDVGAYPIHLSLNSPEGIGPNWLLYRLDDAAAVDRITLGHVIRPWQGDLSGATPLSARFGEQIELQGARLQGEPVPGGVMTLELFWRALRRPDDNYTVFVHLLDEQDQLVLGADREPLEGRFPTGVWPAGELVGSEHPLDLPPDLAPGRYRLVTGLYLWQSGERLPAADADGAPLPDGVMPLPFSIEAP